MRLGEQDRERVASGSRGRVGGRRQDILIRILSGCLIGMSIADSRMNGDLLGSASKPFKPKSGSIKTSSIPMLQSSM